MMMFNIFLMQDSYEQKIARKMLIESFEVYVEQLIKLMDQYNYTIGDRLEN